jgi:predicted alpha/beta superfamily hydrolase
MNTLLLRSAMCLSVVAATTLFTHNASLASTPEAEPQDEATFESGMAALDPVAAKARRIELRSEVPGLAPEGLRVRVFLPVGYDANDPVGYPVLYVNDGQDAEAVHLQSAADAMTANRDEGLSRMPPETLPPMSTRIRPLIVVAIDAPKDRMAAYGFSDRAAGRSLPAQTRFGTVGASAHAYGEWLAKTLVPVIDARYRTRARPDARAILGWSLGGASALNLGWQYPDVFGRVGAFSPSLWLAAEKGDAQAAQRTRIAQAMIASGQYHAGSKFFFTAGDKEETDDRDGDGTIDVLDDARDLTRGWREGGNGEDDNKVRAKGLRQLGHSVSPSEDGAPSRADATLYVLPDGEHHQTSWGKMLPVFLRWAYAVRAPGLNATGTTEGWQRFASRHVAARDIDIWLPPSYDENSKKRYPVLYMHDGQNLFDPSLSYTGVDWDIDGAMTRLIEHGEVREAIVVGIWNTPARFAEYMPRAPVNTEKVSSGILGRPAGRATDIVSDDYLRFLAEELKPAIDARYRTLPERDHTFVMGSSMGGLISLYAAAKYPDVFGGVGAVSTHWPICNGCMIDWLKTQLPAPGAHRWYYDFGTATLDAQYPPYQAKMDAIMRERGYTEGRDWLTRRFEGAEHNEAAWKARVEIPLKFLLGETPAAP